MADTATPVREPRSSDPQEAEDAPSTAGAALDLLLTEAGLGTRQRFLPGRAAAPWRSSTSSKKSTGSVALNTLDV